MFATNAVATSARYLGLAQLISRAPGFETERVNTALFRGLEPLCTAGWIYKAAPDWIRQTLRFLPINPSMPRLAWPSASPGISSPLDACLRCKIGARECAAAHSSAHANPTIPEAGSACPDAALWATSANGASGELRGCSARSAAPTSIGSPRAVPVP